jgi:arylsulfatase A-like enzyme/Flp pilus assembly protein TadD
MTALNKRSGAAKSACSILPAMARSLPRRVVPTSPNRRAALGLILAAALGALAYLVGTRETQTFWSAAVLPRGNVLLITLDTVRADRVVPPEGAPLTPALGRLMREGRVYTTAYSHTPLTLPAHASILTGLHPPGHGVRGNGSYRLAAEHVTLAERLRAAGNRSGAFVGAFVLDARFGLDQGFDQYDGVADDRLFAQDFAFAERRAESVLAGAERWVLSSAAEEATRPWFAWVHLFDAHTPYDAPVAMSPLPYDNEIAYADHHLGAFLQRLRERGALDRTLIIVTADHGEGLGDHGEQTHGLFAYDSTLRVPLIIHAPGLGHGVHDVLATHADIVPTVMDVVGLETDRALPGRSLRQVTIDSGQDGVAYLEAMDGWLMAGAAPLTAIVVGAWKLIELPVPELYDLAADPRETRNRFASEPDRVRAMTLRLRALGQETTASARAPRDAEAEARLRALGYASSSPPAIGHGGFTSADDPKVVRPLYERFLQVLSSGDQGRIADLIGIVEARPSFVAARLTAASMLIDARRAADAVALLAEQADLPGAPLGFRERLGAALLAAGRAEDAERVLTDATADPQASADAWNALGVARASRGRPAEAAAAFDRAVVLAPDSARYWFNRALARRDAGDTRKAGEDLAALTTRHPDFVDGWRALADVRFQAADRAGAVVAWRQVLALAPSDLDTLFNLAITLRDLGRTEDARRAAAEFTAKASPAHYRREIALLQPLTAR